MTNPVKKGKYSSDVPKKGSKQEKILKRQEIMKIIPRACIQWSPEEDEVIKKNLLEGKNFTEIAALHQRSEKSVKRRVYKLAINDKVTNDTKSVEQICAEYQVESEVFSKMLYRYTKTQTKKKERLEKEKLKKGEYSVLKEDIEILKKDMSNILILLSKLNVEQPTNVVNEEEKCVEVDGDEDDMEL
jgi:hypothetical protein